jgi:hypothetical protein
LNDQSLEEERRQLEQQSMKVLVDYVRTSIEILLQMKLEKQHIKQIAERKSHQLKNLEEVPKSKHLQGNQEYPSIFMNIAQNQKKGGSMLIKNGHEKEILACVSRGTAFNNILG